MLNILVSLAIAAITAGSPSSLRPCKAFSDGERWQLTMAAPDSAMVLTAWIAQSNGTWRLVGTSTSREGTNEPLDYPLDSLRVYGDSLRFAFAPLGIRVSGRCQDTNTIRVTFSHPQASPYGPIVGTGLIKRRR